MIKVSLMPFTPIALYSKLSGIWYSGIQYYHLTGKNLKEIYISYKVIQNQICDAHMFTHNMVVVQSPLVQLLIFLLHTGALTLEAS
jgi:hypothetical protein